MSAKRLVEAARRGDSETVEALLAKGVKGTRAQLIEAARAGETGVVDVLVRSGTRGTRKQLAAARGAGEAAVVEALLRSGAGSDEEWLVATIMNQGAGEATNANAGVEATLSIDLSEVLAPAVADSANETAAILMRTLAEARDEGVEDDEIAAFLARAVVDVAAGNEKWLVAMVGRALATALADAGDKGSEIAAMLAPALVEAGNEGDEGDETAAMLASAFAGEGADADTEEPIMEFRVPEDGLFDFCRDALVQPELVKKIKELLAAGEDPNEQAPWALDCFSLTPLANAVGEYLANGGDGIGGGEGARDTLRDIIDAMVGAGADTDEAREFAERWGARDSAGDAEFVLEALDRARRRREAGARTESAPDGAGVPGKPRRP